MTETYCQNCTNKNKKDTHVVSCYEHMKSNYPKKITKPQPCESRKPSPICFQPIHNTTIHGRTSDEKSIITFDNIQINTRHSTSSMSCNNRHGSNRHSDRQTETPHHKKACCAQCYS